MLLRVLKIIGFTCEILQQIRSVRVIETHLKPKHQLVSYGNPLGRESMSVFFDNYHPAVPHLE